MKLAYTLRAIADIEEIAEHLQARSPRGAANVRSAILATLGLLVEFPRLGRAQSVATVRKIGVRRYPYLV